VEKHGSGTMERIESLVDEHEMIIEAIEKEDYTIARKCLHFHLDTIERYSDQNRT
jgi:DNA-binding GntR family transcriptional regulator